jgi:hypothetical protein
MKRLLRNKSVIQIVATLVILIAMILVGIAMIEVAKNQPNNMKCYWTNRGMFCISELEGDK